MRPNALPLASALLICFIIGCTAPAQRPIASLSPGATSKLLPDTISEPQAIRDLRPRLATLRPGMTDWEVFDRLGLTPFTSSAGCLCHWTYWYRFSTNFHLLVRFERRP